MDLMSTLNLIADFSALTERLGAAEKAQESITLSPKEIGVLGDVLNVYNDMLSKKSPVG